MTLVFNLQDRALASHVLAVHKEGRAPRPEGVADALTPDELRAYIAEAKQHQPHVPNDLTGGVHSRLPIAAVPRDHSAVNRITADGSGWHTPGCLPRL